MNDHVDVAVLGMGPGGEVAASRLLAAGRTVAVLERELIGSECAYWACVPSKTVLRPPEVLTEAGRAAGIAETRLDWAETREYRDYMARGLDDSAQATGYEEQGATVIRGEARITVSTSPWSTAGTGCSAVNIPRSANWCVTTWSSQGSMSG